MVIEFFFEEDDVLEERDFFAAGSLTASGLAPGRNISFPGMSGERTSLSFAFRILSSGIP